MIRVMVVEDSPMIADMVVMALESSPEIQVVGVVAEGNRALERAKALRPDVITMDIVLPGLSGLDATREIMREFPTPIVVLTSINDRREADIAFQSLAAGALTVMDKPQSFIGCEGEEFAKVLVQQVKTSCRVNMNKEALRLPVWASTHTTEPSLPPAIEPRILRTAMAQPHAIIGIGASAGGPVCLTRLLSALPADARLPIVLVQHISKGFLLGFLDWLSGQVKRPAKVAEEGERPANGLIYTSREDAHLEFAIDGTFRYSLAPPLRGHRPSVDALFYSLAERYGPRAIGVLLTGMGNDGALGLKKMRESGGATFAQDEASSLVFGMPKEALRLGAVDRVHSIEAIAMALANLGSGRNR